MYKKCEYADMTEFGLVCDYQTGYVLKNSEYPCPKDSGTDGKRNGICYSYCSFDKGDNIDADWQLIIRLMHCFPRSFINQNGEFIARLKSNTYFRLTDCKTELDVKCKVLEWLSRAAYKTEPYRRKDKNDEFHVFMLKGVNEFLGTSFTAEEMEQIYTYLGNACNHEKTVRFVESGYDMGMLEG